MKSMKDLYAHKEEIIQKAQETKKMDLSDVFLFSVFTGAVGDVRLEKRQTISEKNPAQKSAISTMVYNYSKAAVNVLYADNTLKAYQFFLNQEGQFNLEFMGNFLGMAVDAIAVCAKTKRFFILSQNTLYIFEPDQEDPTKVELQEVPEGKVSQMEILDNRVIIAIANQIYMSPFVVDTADEIEDEISKPKILQHNDLIINLKIMKIDKGDSHQDVLVSCTQKKVRFWNITHGTELTANISEDDKEYFEGDAQDNEDENVEVDGDEVEEKPEGDEEKYIENRKEGAREGHNDHDGAFLSALEVLAPGTFACGFTNGVIKLFLIEHAVDEDNVSEPLTGRRIGGLKGFKSTITAVKYSPDLNFVACSDSNGEVCIFEMQWKDGDLEWHQIGKSYYKKGGINTLMWHCNTRFSHQLLLGDTNGVIELVSLPIRAVELSDLRTVFDHFRLKNSTLEKLISVEKANKEKAKSQLEKGAIETKIKAIELQKVIFDELNLTYIGIKNSDLEMFIEFCEKCLSQKFKLNGVAQSNHEQLFQLFIPQNNHDPVVAEVMPLNAVPMEVKNPEPSQPPISSKFQRKIVHHVRQQEERSILSEGNPSNAKSNSSKNPGSMTVKLPNHKSPKQVKQPATVGHQPSQATPLSEINFSARGEEAHDIRPQSPLADGKSNVNLSPGLAIPTIRDQQSRARLLPKLRPQTPQPIRVAPASQSDPARSLSPPPSASRLSDAVILVEANSGKVSSNLSASQNAKPQLSKAPSAGANVLGPTSPSASLNSSASSSLSSIASFSSSSSLSLNAGASSSSSFSSSSSSSSSLSSSASVSASQSPSPSSSLSASPSPSPSAEKRQPQKPKGVTIQSGYDLMARVPPPVIASQDPESINAASTQPQPLSPRPSIPGPQPNPPGGAPGGGADSPKNHGHVSIYATAGAPVVSPDDVARRPVVTHNPHRRKNLPVFHQAAFGYDNSEEEREGQQVEQENEENENKNENEIKRPDPKSVPASSAPPAEGVQRPTTPILRRDGKGSQRAKHFSVSFSENPVGEQSVSQSVPSASDAPAQPPAINPAAQQALSAGEQPVPQSVTPTSASQPQSQPTLTATISSPASKEFSSVSTGTSKAPVNGSAVFGVPKSGSESSLSSSPSPSPASDPIASGEKRRHAKKLSAMFDKQIEDEKQRVEKLRRDKEKLDANKNAHSKKSPSSKS